MDKTFDNAPYLLRCLHSLNSESKIPYWQRCHRLGITKSMKVKVLVWGKRHRSGYENESRVRYVNGNRLIDAATADPRTLALWGFIAGRDQAKDALNQEKNDE